MQSMEILPERDIFHSSSAFIATLSARRLVERTVALLLTINMLGRFNDHYVGVERSALILSPLGYACQVHRLQKGKEAKEVEDRIHRIYKLLPTFMSFSPSCYHKHG